MDIKTNPIRVLHVLGGLNRGGAETMVMNIYRSINREKIQFDFVIHMDAHCDYTDEILQLGGKIYSCPRYTGKNHSKYCRWWKEFLEKHEEFYIVHGHVRSTAAVYLRIAKNKGRKTISHSHNTSSGKGITAFIKNVMQIPIRHIADYFFACSVEAGKWLFGKKVVSGEKFYIIKNAIDTEKYRFSDEVRNVIRSELGIEDKFVVGHIGRFHEQKNHRFIVEIFDLFNKKEPNSVLLLIGTGELEKEIKQQVVDMGIQQQVIFLGVRDDVHKILQAMDVFVFPSWFEGLGMVAIEAEATGLPVLCSDRIPADVDLTDIIEFISLDKPEKWIEKMCYMIQHKVIDEKYNLIIKNAGYDVTITAQRLEQFYLKLV